jgi:hypothetical protein
VREPVVAPASGDGEASFSLAELLEEVAGGEIETVELAVHPT